MDPLPDWDSRCGFNSGDDVTKVRSEEDDAALEMFGARGTRLEYWPQQYRPGPTSGLLRRLIDRVSPRLRDKDGLVGQLEPDVTRVIDELRLPIWFLPLGIGHPDHKLTTVALLRVARSRPEIKWVAYEDLPYARQGKHLLAQARSLVANQGFELAEWRLQPSTHFADKRSAVSCYRSQLRALGPLAETAIQGPERFYRLVDARGPASR